MLCPVHYIKKSAKTPVFLIKKSAKKRGKYRYNSGPKKTLRVYLRTTCTSAKGLYGHQRSTCELYRNMVSTRVCANNFFSVVQNGSAVVPGHYRAQLCKGKRTRVLCSPRLLPQSIFHLSALRLLCVLCCAALVLSLCVALTYRVLQIPV